MTPLVLGRAPLTESMRNRRSSEIVNPQSVARLSGEDFGHALRRQPPYGIGGVGGIFRIANDHSILIDCMRNGRVAAQSFEELQAHAGSSVEPQVARAGLVEADNLPGIVDRLR